MTQPVTKGQTPEGYAIFVSGALRLLGLSAGVSLQLTSMHNAAAGALDSGAPSG